MARSMTCFEYSYCPIGYNVAIYVRILVVFVGIPVVFIGFLRTQLYGVALFEGSPVRYN